MTFKKLKKHVRENQPLPQTIIKGYLLRTAHQKRDGTLVDFKRFCLNELAELTCSGLFEAAGLVRNLNSDISAQKASSV